MELQKKLVTLTDYKYKLSGFKPTPDHIIEEILLWSDDTAKNLVSNIASSIQHSHLQHWEDEHMILGERDTMPHCVKNGYDCQKCSIIICPIPKAQDTSKIKEILGIQHEPEPESEPESGELLPGSDGFVLPRS